MKEQNFIFFRILKTLVFGILFLFHDHVKGQTIMFDDFTYTGITDPQLPVFNKWNIINGTSGPPEGAQYSSNNISFITDPANAANKLMLLNTTVNGQNKATTHSRIETSDFSYFEGTYAARVYFSDNPFTYQDANIQTFFTIVSSDLAGDGTKYSELDFEYMAADKWGIADGQNVFYLTSWNRYIADPWQAWKRYFYSQKSWAGWHTCIVSCTDKVNVKFWIDGTYFGAMSTTDNDGTSVYPRSPMQMAFANWIWNNVVGSNTANRTTTMQVDWTLYYKNQELSLTQVNDLVATYRTQGLQRRNLAGQTYITSTNQAPQVQLTAPANNSSYTAPANITITANATDADGTISKVEFFNGTTLLGSVTSAPYTFNWTNVAAGTYSITAKATDNSGNATTSTSVSVTVSVPESPYGGTRATIPGTIQAENYDLGGQNVAYNDLTATNDGGAYRTDAVDIEAITGGGYDVGYIQAGEWMKYMVNVSTAGTYKIEAYVAATTAGQSFTLDLDGTSIATVNVPNTGGWQTFQNVTIDNVSLTAGNKVLRFNATTSNFNLDKVVFTLATNVLPSVSITSPANNATFTAPESVTINATANDSDGSVSKVEFYNGVNLLGTDNTSPYSYIWSGAAAGTYSITAKAYDNAGASTTSTPISITVSIPGINQYTINKTLSPITVDGVLNEQDWTNAPFTENLLNMDGSVATLTTKGKMLWSDNYLYFAFIVQDNSMWSTLTARDAQLWTQDVLEVLIDKDGDGVNYSEIGFAPNGDIYDLVMDKPYSAGGTSTTSWDINGLTVKTTVTGTMNTATGGVQWLVEAALPFAGIPASPATFGKPNAGDMWRLNLARADHNYNDVNSEKLYTWTYTDGVTNHLPSRFGKVIFGAGPNVAPTISITAPINNAIFTAPASVTINATANDTDGSISKVEFYNGTTLLNSDNTSPYSYNWTGVAAGTYTITAKAYDNLNLSATSTAITIVVNNPNVAPTVSITAPTNNATFTAPASVTINATANDTDGSISKVEFYNGTTLLNSDNASPYSYNWTGVAAGSYTITAKAYDNLNLSTTSTAITIVVNNPNVAPIVSITAPTNNAPFTAPASVTINATANDTDGSISKVEFYNGTTLLNSDNASPYSYNWTGVAAGTYTITAKAYDNLNLSSTSTDITIVVNNPNVAPTVSITAPTNNATFTAPASVTINATANDTDGSVYKVEFYNGTTLLNSDNASPFTYNWTGVAAGTYIITAKAYDNLNLSTTSTAITIVVNNPNVAPTVSITSPSNNATFAAPASVTINATANDTDGSISKVEFYNGTTLLNSDNTSPYSYIWTVLTAGTYTITAKVYDNLNLSTTSTAITIVVNNPNQNPTVSITSPTNNAAFTAPASVSLSANASDVDGSISKVEYYNGTTLLGSATVSPYSYNWTGVAAGTYSITAKAYDNSTGIATSSAVTIIVSNPNHAPVVEITSPSNNSSFEMNAPIVIIANAIDSDGSIVKVEFYNGINKIGESMNAPYSFTWTQSTLGNYTISAQAIDNLGARASSSDIHITITNTTGVLSNAIDSDIKLFPNPFENVIHFNKEVSSLKIMDLTGHVLDNFQTNIQNIDLSNYVEGTYILIGEYNNRTFVLRIVKSK